MLTVEVPVSLREEFERQARQIYGEDGIQQALVEAIELWLSRAQEQALRVARQKNHRAYMALKAELEAKHPGEWAVIAHGRLQGVSPNLDDVKHLALGEGHRLVFKIGERIHRRRERLWRIRRG